MPPKTHNANVKIVKHMSSMQYMQSSYQNLIMRPSSTDVFCLYPSAESRKKQHSTRFHCTASVIACNEKVTPEGLCDVSAGMPATNRQFMENFCMSLCNICHLIHRTTESQKRNYSTDHFNQIIQDTRT